MAVPIAAAGGGRTLAGTTPDGKGPLVRCCSLRARWTGTGLCECVSDAIFICSRSFPVSRQHRPVDAGGGWNQPAVWFFQETGTGTLRRVGGGLGALTWQQAGFTGTWNALARHAGQNPDCWLAHNNLACAFKSGRNDEAMDHYHKPSRSIRMTPKR